MTKAEEMIFYKELGKRIAHFRKKQGFTQEELAKKLGIKQSILAYYETGKRRPQTSTLITIAQTLYIDFEDLLGLDKKPAKRGPISDLQKKIDKIKSLPASKQKMVVEFIDKIIQITKAS
jgi:transcriptional regulator with XRE-family HTH domain